MKTKIITLFVIVVILITVMILSPQLMNALIVVINGEFSSLTLTEQSVYTSSIHIRLRLIKIGFRFLVDSYLLGIGSGNFEAHMNLSEMTETGNIFNPHNLFLEIGVNNGVIVLAFFVFLYIKQIMHLLKLYKQNKSSLTLHYLILGFTFIIAASASSSISGYYLFWIFLFYFFFGYREIEAENVLLLSNN